MKKHYKYFRYLVRHKWFVFIAGVKTGAPIWRLVIHDWSKFMPCEWFPYADFFYGTEPTSDTWKQWKKDRFDDAWLHHQHLNAHHWQHWILKNDNGSVRALYIPQRYVREMVADWMGAGRAITGRWETIEWYEKNKDKIILHVSSQQLVERLLVEAAKKKMIDIIITLLLFGGMWFGTVVVARNAYSKPINPVPTKYMLKIDRNYPFYYPFIRRCSIHCDSKWRKV